MANSDSVSVRYVHLNASGLAFAYPAYARMMMCASSTGSAGTVYFYNKTSAPGGGDTPVGQFDIIEKGYVNVNLPEPGLLFDKGCYVVLPADTKMNLFFSAA
jgi:hypothetical protein